MQQLHLTPRRLIEAYLQNIEAAIEAIERDAVRGSDGGILSDLVRLEPMMRGRRSPLKNGK